MSHRRDKSASKLIRNRNNQSPDRLPMYSTHVVVMQALEPLHTGHEDTYYTFERNNPQIEDRLMSGADKQSENEEWESKKKKPPYGGQTKQQTEFCFGEKKKKDKSKKHGSKDNLSTASSYDTISSEYDAASESRTISKLTKGTKDSTDSKISGTNTESNESSSEPDNMKTAKETIGWDESKAKEDIDASMKNMQNKLKQDPYKTQNSSNPEGNTRNQDVATPVRVFPGIGSQKRRTSEEADNVQRSARKNKPWEDQTQRKKPDGRRKPAQFISVKAPRSASKVITKRRYHIQIPEEGRKDTWFNAHFNFNDDRNIDWRYEGPVKIKNYYSTSNYT